MLPFFKLSALLGLPPQTNNTEAIEFYKKFGFQVRFHCKSGGDSQQHKSAGCASSSRSDEPLVTRPRTLSFTADHGDATRLL